jgi:hypothetical protein
MTFWAWVAMIAAMLWPFAFAAAFTYAGERMVYWRNPPTFRQFLRRTFTGEPYPK